MSDNDLTIRERMALHVLFWILRLLNPTGYKHEVEKLLRDIQREANGRP